MFVPNRIRHCLDSGLFVLRFPFPPPYFAASVLCWRLLVLYFLHPMYFRRMRVRPLLYSRYLYMLLNKAYSPLPLPGLLFPLGLIFSTVAYGGSAPHCSFCSVVFARWKFCSFALGIGGPCIFLYFARSPQFVFCFPVYSRCGFPLLRPFRDVPFPKSARIRPAWAVSSMSSAYSTSPCHGCSVGYTRGCLVSVRRFSDAY